jgi:hypothetical protein
MIKTELASDTQIPMQKHMKYEKTRQHESSKYSNSTRIYSNGNKADKIAKNSKE